MVVDIITDKVQHEFQMADDGDTIEDFVVHLGIEKTAEARDRYGRAMEYWASRGGIVLFLISGKHAGNLRGLFLSPQMISKAKVGIPLSFSQRCVPKKRNSGRPTLPTTQCV